MNMCYFRLVVAVAKDLQSDFYPKFPKFFIKLVDLLQVREPEITERTFTTLAYLYKNLWRLLIKDIQNVYGLLLPLLASNQPEHVQQFATESFAFIGRKVGDRSGFVELIFTKLQENTGDSLGVGQLLFQIVKGIKNQFHTSLELFLPIYFKYLSSIEQNVSNDPVFIAINHCFLLMARHTSPQHCSRVWILLLVKLFFLSLKPRYVIIYCRHCRQLSIIARGQEFWACYFSFNNG
jgi:U3 small nucleolar RNA-associated protein 20